MISLILSGGVGSRLWPLSRQKLPKQFSPLFGKNLFHMTVERLNRMGEVQVCTGEGLRIMTETTIRQNDLNVSQVFYEPVGRNTAPAIALACLWAQRQKQTEEVMGVFPSDHWIDREEEFFDVLKLAQTCAKKNQIVTLGLKPDYPATGFGYIECLSEEFESAGDLKAFIVKGFREKPDEKTAREFIEKGNFFWNSGMFVFKVQTMISAFETLMPDLWQSLSKLDDLFSNIDEVFPRLSSQSIDYGVMEKFKNQVNIPCSLDWNDLGSWDDVAEIADLKNLSFTDSIFTNDSKNCFAFSDTGKAIAFSKVDDLIVVDTADALLVTSKKNSQSVKELYEKIKVEKPELVSDHVFENRPWGSYRNLWEQHDFKTKVIQVDAGQQLSYQSHKKRSEIWIVVRGRGEVVLNEEVLSVEKGSVIEVPQGAKHRMRNSTKEALVFVEVQLGESFEEEDITRYQDDYKRV